MRARDNPFATDRVLRIRYRFREGTVRDLLKRLHRLGNRGAIVGPEGSGKTTLLEDLQSPFRRAGYSVRRLGLSQERRRFSREEWSTDLAGLSPDDMVLLDGAEQLSRWHWWRVLRRTSRCGLVVTSHRAGLLPTLIECETSVELLRGIAEQLLDEPLSTSRLPQELFQKHSGNLRDALREMYDLWADR